jgi:hypothetical protein
MEWRAGSPLAKNARLNEKIEEVRTLAEFRAWRGEDRWDSPTILKGHVHKFIVTFSSDPSKASETKQGYLKEFHRSMTAIESRLLIRDGGSEKSAALGIHCPILARRFPAKVLTDGLIVEVAALFFEINMKMWL